jgi:pimeloyl-ACP methyl ester carboxylesterase
LTLEMPTLEGVQHRHVTVDGVSIHVAEAGSGPPLVLQHGWPQNWWAWRHVIAALAPHHRVICPDLRGFGWSDAPSRGYEKERLASDLLGLLDALELERVGLAGHDWGGFVGFLACLRAPERFTGYVALAITHPWMQIPRIPDPRQLARAWYQLVIASPVLGGALLRRERVTRTLIERAGAGVWDEQSRELYARALSRPATVAATVALYRSFLTRELPELRGGRYDDVRLEVPTLLVVGDRDPVITPPALAGFEQHGDELSLEWVPGAGHWLPEELPELVVERIRRVCS